MFDIARPPLLSFLKIDDTGSTALSELMAIVQYNLSCRIRLIKIY